MASNVYFWNLRTTLKSPFDKRLEKLLKKVGVKEFIEDGDLTAIKIHFGEKGTTGFIRPLWLRPIIDFFRTAKAKPFLTDASTLYVGQRGEAVSHQMCAAHHGWDPLVLGAPVIIADGLKGNSETAVPVGGKHIKEAYIGADIADADLFISVNHFKGHELAGYGGALKNVGMGSASKRGKMQQHYSTGPIINPENCKGCEQCVKICKPGALSLGKDKKIQLNPERCVGCGGCFLGCKSGALQIDWKIGVQEFLERMMEYALAVVRTKNRPCLHINFVVDVVPDCDCVGFTDQSLCPNIGILASFDPVAVDQACLDLVNAAQPLFPSKLPSGTKPGDDKFLAIHTHCPPDFGLEYAAKIGLGTREYTLINV